MSKYRYEIEVQKNDGYVWRTTRVCLIAENPEDAVERAVELGCREPGGRPYLNIKPIIISCEELVDEAKND